MSQGKVSRNNLWRSTTHKRWLPIVVLTVFNLPAGSLGQSPVVMRSGGPSAYRFALGPSSILDSHAKAVRWHRQLAEGFVFDCILAGIGSGIAPLPKASTNSSRCSSFCSNLKAVLSPGVAIQTTSCSSQILNSGGPPSIEPGVIPPRHRRTTRNRWMRAIASY